MSSSKAADKDFEGVATIISSMNQKDFRKLVKYVLNISMDSPNILRVLFYTLENVDNYKGKFKSEILRFKASYEKQFKKECIKLGRLNYIDKLDLLNALKNTFEKRGV